MGGKGSGRRRIPSDLAHYRPGVGAWRRGVGQLAGLEAKLRREQRTEDAKIIRSVINQILLVAPRVVVGVDERGYPVVKQSSKGVRVYIERRT